MKRLMLSCLFILSISLFTTGLSYAQPPVPPTPTPPSSPTFDSPTPTITPSPTEPRTDATPTITPTPTGSRTRPSATPTLNLGDATRTLTATPAFPTSDYIPLVATAGRTFITAENLDQVGLLARIIPPNRDENDAEYGIVAVDFSPDGRYIAVGDNLGTVHLYDFIQLRAGNQTPIFSRKDGTLTMWDIAFHPFRDMLITCTADNMLTLSDFDGNILAQYNTSISATQCNYSPDGQYIIFAGGEMVKFFIVYQDDGVRIGEIERTLSQNSVHDAIFSPDGIYMFTAGGTGFTVWDTETYSSLLTPYESNTWSVNPLPNGDMIATGSNGFVAMYSDEGILKRTFVGHSMDVIESAYNPNATLFVTGSWDNNVHFWDASGEINAPLHTLNHGDYIVDVGWSRDGAVVASVGNNGYLLLWGIP